MQPEYCTAHLLARQHPCAPASATLSSQLTTCLCQRPGSIINISMLTHAVYSLMTAGASVPQSLGPRNSLSRPRLCNTSTYHCLIPHNFCFQRSPFAQKAVAGAILAWPQLRNCTIRYHSRRPSTPPCLFSVYSLMTVGASMPHTLCPPAPHRIFCASLSGCSPVSQQVMGQQLKTPTCMTCMLLSGCQSCSAPCMQCLCFKSQPHGH